MLRLLRNSPTADLARCHQRLALAGNSAAINLQSSMLSCFPDMPHYARHLGHAEGARCIALLVSGVNVAGSMQIVSMEPDSGP